MNHWTDEELQTLRARYATSTCSEMRAALPGRSGEEIRYKARDLGLRKEPQTIKRSARGALGAWSAEEEQTLAHVWTTAPLDRVFASLPGRTKAAIQEKARNMKLRRPEHEIRAARLANALKGSAALQAQRKFPRLIAKAMKHPIEAAWRGLAQTS